MELKKVQQLFFTVLLAGCILPVTAGDLPAVSRAKKYLRGRVSGDPVSSFSEAISVAGAVLETDPELAEEVLAHAAEGVSRMRKPVDWKGLCQEFPRDVRNSGLVVAVAAHMNSWEGVVIGESRVQMIYEINRGREERRLKEEKKKNRVGNYERAIEHGMKSVVPALTGIKHHVVSLRFLTRQRAKGAYDDKWIASLPDSPVKTQLQLQSRLVKAPTKAGEKILPEPVKAQLSSLLLDKNVSGITRVRYFIEVVRESWWSYSGTKEFILPVAEAYLEIPTDNQGRSLYAFMGFLYSVMDEPGWRETAQQVCRHTHQILRNQKHKLLGSTVASLTRLAFVCGLNDLGKELFLKQTKNLRSSPEFQLAILHCGDADWYAKMMEKDVAKCTIVRGMWMQSEARNLADEVLPRIKDKRARMFFRAYYAAIPVVSKGHVLARDGKYDQTEELQSIAVELCEELDQYSVSQLQHLQRILQRFSELDAILTPLYLRTGKTLTLRDVYEKKQSYTAYAKYLAALVAIDPESAMKKIEEVSKPVDAKHGAVRMNLLERLDSAIQRSARAEFTRDRAGYWVRVLSQYSTITSPKRTGRKRYPLTRVAEHIFVASLLMNRPDEFKRFCNGEMHEFLSSQRLSNSSTGELIGHVQLPDEELGDLLRRAIELRTGSASAYFMNTAAYFALGALRSERCRRNLSLYKKIALDTLRKKDPKEAGRLARAARDLTPIEVQPEKPAADKLKKNSAQPRFGAGFEAHRSSVTALQWTRDGRLMSVGADSQLILWKLPQAKIKTFTSRKNPITTAAISLDGKFLASTGSDGVIRIHKLDEATQEPAQLRLADKRITQICFSSDARRIIAADIGGNAVVWDRDGKELARFRLERGIRSITFAPSEALILGAGLDRVVHVWHMESRKEVAQLTGHTFGIRCAAMSADGKRIAAGSDDGTLRVWKQRDQNNPIVLKGHRASVTACVFVNDNTLVSSSLDGTVRAWHSGNAQQTAEAVVAADGIESLAVSADGKSLAIGQSDGKITVIAVKQLREKKE